MLGGEVVEGGGEVGRGGTGEAEGSLVIFVIEDGD